MDLTDILRKRAEADLAVAMARSLELSFGIEAAADEIKSLRAKLAELEGRPGDGFDSRPQRQPRSEHETFVSHEDGNSLRDGSGRSLHQRLFGKFVSRTTQKAQFHWHLDEIAGTFPVRDKNGVNAVVSGTSFPTLTFSGWIVPTEENPAFTAVEISLAGSHGLITRGTQTFHRADVAAHFGRPSLSSCGFRLEIPMFEIPTGQYALKISGSTPDGIAHTLSAGAITIS